MTHGKQNGGNFQRNDEKFSLGCFTATKSDWTKKDIHNLIHVTAYFWSSFCKESMLQVVREYESRFSSFENLDCKAKYNAHDVTEILNFFDFEVVIYG